MNVSRPSPRPRRFIVFAAALLAVLAVMWFLPRLPHIDYASARASLADERSQLARQYSGANAESRKRVLEQARNEIEQALNTELFPAWLGTRYGFNGVTEEPGKGSIACGSFVVTLLRHAGFEVPRKMLRQPSGNIIKNLVTSGPVRTFSGRDEITRVIDWVEAHGEGLYMVGLDTHVGILVYRDGDIRFWHSSSLFQQVVSQRWYGPSSLLWSRIRVVGKLFDDEMIEKWLLEQPFPMTYDYFSSS